MKNNNDINIKNFSKVHLTILALLSDNRISIIAKQSNCHRINFWGIFNEIRMSEGSYFIHKYESYINDKTLRFRNAFEAILFYYI